MIAAQAPNTGTPSASPEVFLRSFPGHWVQYFDDGPLKDRRKALATPHFDAEEARRKQQDGCGVFFSPNAFDGMRRIENLQRVQAAFIDLDLAREGDGTLEVELHQRQEAALAALRSGPLPPQVVIQTKHGLQAIWRVEPLPPSEGLALFQETEDLLVARFHADPAARDVTRVLRLPGFLHLKNPAQPFVCRLLYEQLASPPYALRQLRDAFRADPISAGPAGAAVPAPQPAKKWQEGLAGVPEGRRNDTAASIAGRMLAGLPEELWETGGWGGLKEWNLQNPIPLPERELRSVLQNIVRREQARRHGGAGVGRPADSADRAAKAQADRLIALVFERDVVLFRDQFGEPHAHLSAGAGRRTCKLKSGEFREWLARQLWETERKACGTEALSAALNTLAGKTRFEGQRLPLECRVARHGEAIWYDLADDRGRAVRVTPDGWAIVERPPILFRRFPHQLPQLAPVRGRPLTALLPFVSLADPRRNPLLLVYLVTCFIPDIPHPIAVFFGPQGSAKSTLCRLLRRLIDPTALEGLALPARDELPQILFHHWFPAFDNVSTLGSDVSDLLCRAVTGEGFSRRKLYSDDEDLICQFRRPLCLNGINLAAARPDLLDRCILFPLERLPDERRREETAVLLEFERLRPELLGAIFSALAGAMRLHPTLAEGALPRMADFARWGAAIAEPLGIGAGAFLALYRDNIREQHEEAIEESAAAVTVLEFMATRDEWSGTPTELLAALALHPAAGGQHADRGLPKNANALTKQLNVMRTNLAQVGVVVETSRRTKRRRTIHLRKAAAHPLPEESSRSRGDGDGGRKVGDSQSPPSPIVPPVLPHNGDGDDGDDNRPLISFPPGHDGA